MTRRYYADKENMDIARSTIQLRAEYTIRQAKAWRKQREDLPWQGGKTVMLHTYTPVSALLVLYSADKKNLTFKEMVGGESGMAWKGGACLHTCIRISDGVLAQMTMLRLHGLQVKAA